MVVAPSARDPFLAPLVGRAHLHDAFAIVPAEGQARLAYQSPLEREEAAATGLALLTPEQLDIARSLRDGADPASLLATSLARALQYCGLVPGPVLLAGHAAAGTLAVACAALAGEGWRFGDGAWLVRAWRKQKRYEDLEECRRVARATSDCMRAVAARLATSERVAGRLRSADRPLTVGQLRAEVAHRLADAGLEQPHGNLIAPGAEGAVPHNAGADRSEIHVGQTVIVDLFPRGRLFADMTRTFVVGMPSEAVAGAHAEVLAALRAARAATRTGVRAWSLQELVCDRFRSAGWSDPIAHPESQAGYVHGLGHGVGFEVHELPSFRREASDHDGTLAIGDVLTLEPGLYEPDAGWAVRLEDTFHLAGAGLECLTELPYDLDPRAY